MKKFLFITLIMSTIVTHGMLNQFVTKIAQKSCNQRLLRKISTRNPASKYDDKWILYNS